MLHDDDAILNNNDDDIFNDNRAVLRIWGPLDKPDQRPCFSMSLDFSGRGPSELGGP